VGFGFDMATINAIRPCSDSSNCGPESRLGSAAADTPLGNFNGGVFLGQFPQLFVVLSNGLPLLDQHLTGNVAIRSDGGIDAVFDNLPTFPITRFAVSLDGPPRGILTAPTKCGDYEFRADFTSQNGSHADGSNLITIASNCPAVTAAPPFAITSAAVSPRRWRRGRSTTLRFTLTDPAAIEVTVRKLGSRRILQRRRTSASAGTTRLTRLARRLRPGRYVLTLIATASDGRVVTRSFVVRILPARRR
jgi:hypothetical protein